MIGMRGVVLSKACLIILKKNAVQPIVHAKQVQDSRMMKKNTEAKNARSLEITSSKRMLDVKDKPMSKKRFSNKISSNISKNCNDSDCNPKPQKGRNVYPPKERQTCIRCGKKHVGKCLVGTNSCYGCGKGGHMVKYYPNVRRQGKGNDKA